MKDEPHWVIHYIEIREEAKGFNELDLDPRTNDNNGVKPIEEIFTFQLNIKTGY